MEQNKEILIEIFKKLGEKCTSCGGFFIGAAIEASTEGKFQRIDRSLDILHK